MSKFPTIAFTAITLFFTFTSSSVQAATLIVNSEADQGSQCTLRMAVASINAQVNQGSCQASGGYGTNDKIVFANSVNSIRLSSVLILNRNVFIDGGVDRVAISSALPPSSMIRLFESGSELSDDSTIILRGLNLSGGYQVFQNNPNDFVYRLGFGGAIFVNYGHLIISNSELSNNQANIGGAIVANRLSLDNVVFRDNKAVRNIANTTGGSSAGAAFVYRNMTIRNSQFLSNTAGRSGGALELGRLSDETTIHSIENSVFSENRALDGQGGAIEFGRGTLEISTSKFLDNSSTSDGGAIFSGGNRNHIEITSSTISGNSSGGKGGGIAAYNYLKVTQSLIDNNNAAEGAGIAHRGNADIAGTYIMRNTSLNGGAGIRVYGPNSESLPPHKLTVSHSTIIENTARSGGAGISTQPAGTFDGPDLTVINSSIVNNHSKITNGAGISALGGKLEITNTTISNNSIGMVDPLIPNRFGNGAGLSHWSGKGLRIINSTIASNHAYNQGGGIFIVNPSATDTFEIKNTILSGNQVDQFTGGEIYLNPHNDAYNFSHNVIGHDGAEMAHAVSNDQLLQSLLAAEKNNLMASSDGRNKSTLSSIIEPIVRDGFHFLHRLPAGSIADNVGNIDVCSQVPVAGTDQTDQIRGETRCDIGAVERTTDDGGFQVIPLPGGKAVIIPL